jgi:hypothetical protein
MRILNVNVKMIYFICDSILHVETYYTLIRRRKINKNIIYRVRIREGSLYLNFKKNKNIFTIVNIGTVNKND